MNVILLCGGSGTRLWPLSNNIRSKQFIKLFKNDSGQYESMVQRVYRQIKTVDKDSKILIATAKSQVSAILNQLGKEVNISIEPDRRDTFPAIVLACEYMHEMMGVSTSEPVVVCPVDPYVDNSFFSTLSILDSLVKKEESNLSLCGIEPTCPSEKFGYILPKTKDKVSFVKEFKEKPTTEIAKEYIDNGALWNGGVFAFKLAFLLEKAHQAIKYTDYNNLFNNYSKCKKISFDYAVCEKEKAIQVIRYNGAWKDLGTWNNLCESMDDKVIGNAIMSNSCNNVHIINEDNPPILATGLNDVVIAASPDGILVADKEESLYIKPEVEKIKQEVMYAEKSWGRYRVLEKNCGYAIIKITLYPNHALGYHSHQLRDETWTVLSGSGSCIIDGNQFDISVGSTITAKKGQKHKLTAKTELELVEVQLGKQLLLQDKEKYDD